MKSEEKYCHICKTKCENTLCKNCFVPLFQPVEHHVSFAFLDIPEEFDDTSLSETITLDCFKSGIVKAEITGYSQLRQLRLSHCQKLTKIHLADLPNLISLDAYDSPILTEFTIDNVPNLISVDLSFCPKLATVRGEFPKVEYFSISHTDIDSLPALPMVKYLDISVTKITDIKPLYSFEKLQRLVFLECTTIDTIEVSQLAKHPDFTSIFGSCSGIDFKDCPLHHKIKNILTNGALKNTEKVDLSHTNIYSSSKIEAPHLSFEEPLFSGDWWDSYRYLYGPYPTPPNDSKPFLSEDELESIYNIYPHPPEVDPKKASYHIMGALFGTAIGDCLGLFCEGKEPMVINFFIEQPPDITWTHPLTTARGCHFHRGSFTDDTALMLCFLRSVVSTAVKNIPITEKDEIQNIFDPGEAGSRIHHWILHGVDEHLDGIGIGRGNYTEKVVKMKKYLQNPIEISKKCWKKSSARKLGNGGVMRTGGCGCFIFWDENKVVEIARQFCQCTHYDPICVFSSVLVSLIISRLIQLRSGMTDQFDLDQTIDEVKEMFMKKDEDEKIDDFESIDPFLYADEIESLELLNNRTPATLGTLGCAIWVLRKNFSFEEGIEKVIRVGGDTDTNAACAGAVLGAKWGFGAIPLHIIDYFWYGGILYRDAVPFLKMMGMDFEPPTYEEINKLKY
ncbi:hypothetical protein M9Y10_018972 [Tritrichomonas musculus]|uniref:ADP-ribosylglycohydrolase family protein n=1 Tax=Tritrichomonas musculus TaxID=1915356 RepID=A0ABR2HI71_9EUKA